MTRRFFISGRVQGVGYRHFVRTEAMRLSLVGFAANLPDGRVEVVADGEAHALAELEQLLHRGPRAADVTGVSSEPMQFTEPVTTFSIR